MPDQAIGSAARPRPLAVFFDVGGVLIRTEDLAGRRKWEARLNLEDWGLADVVFNSEPSRLAQVGQAANADVWKHVVERFGLTEAEVEELQRDFWAGDRFDEGLLGYIASLRPRYRTAIVSNAWPNMRAYLMEHDFVARAFDQMFISAELSVAKPDPRIYRAALEGMGLAPDQAVFVDDVPENIEAAQALGMAGVVYRPGLDVPAALAALGVT